MANSTDPDQTAPEGAVWSGSALFAYIILLATLVYEILGHLPYSWAPNVAILVLYFTENASSIHILVIVDTSTNCA